MFENITPEEIKKEILAEAGETLETREGSFLDSMAGPAAVELWKAYQALNGMIPIAFPDASSGGYIDLEGGRYGIYRKEGTKARVVLSFVGRSGTVVPGGTAFLTGDGLAFLLQEAVTLAEGAGTGTAEAEEVGDTYNVDVGAITQMVTTIPGLEQWDSGAAAGGTDQETDAALYARVAARLQKPATSGNVYHYEQWALEVAGVGACRVFPIWNGPGTVKVLLVDSNQAPASTEIVAAAAAHIEEERPIGAAVTVEAGQELPVDVAAAVTTDGTVTVLQVKAALEKDLDAYLKSIMFRADTLLYNRVAYLLLSIPGVMDYTALTINGGTGNVAIGAEQVPVLGEVAVT